MQFTIYFEFIYRYWYQTWKMVQHIFGIRTETKQKINTVHCSRDIYLSVYLFWLLSSVCLYKKLEMSKNSNARTLLNIVGSSFGVLFCLLIKKSILGSKTIWQSMRKFPCAIWSVGTFPHMTFGMQIDVVWNFFT